MTSMRLWVVPIILLAVSCGSSPQVDASASSQGGALVVYVAMSPTCPSEPVSASAICRARPVRGATLHVGHLTLTTDHAGLARTTLPPGSYTLTADQISGDDGAPHPVSLSVRAGETTRLRIAYDTGIR